MFCNFINYFEEIAQYKSVFVLVSDNIAWVYTLINHEYEKYVGNSRLKKELKKKSISDNKKNKKDK